MGKKGNHGGPNLGRSIIRDRFTRRDKSGDSLLHTSELNDDQDWNRLNFQSITEQTHIDEFLSTAELAGTQFQAEKLNVKFVRSTTTAGLLTDGEKKKIQSAQEANRQLLRIPRRPQWTLMTTPEQLAEAERSSFLEWRRSLAELQEVEGITLTPFERNLEFWRQLWRVIERSDVVVQIVDARNPLLFRCKDLESYVTELDPNKDNLLLVNKADFLTERQREYWAQYFRQNKVKAVFFSALDSQDLDSVQEEEEDEEERRLQRESISSASQEDVVSDNEANSPDNSGNPVLEECRNDLEDLASRLKLDDCSKKEEEEVLTEESKTRDTSLSQRSPEDSCHCDDAVVDDGFVTSSRLLSRSELIEVFRTIHTKRRVLQKCTTIGLVGYPNVGKSSTINCLMQEKKVSVSATPGKTKHFQTLYLTEDVLLCDCPGLVFPAFVATKAEMIISGILSIDQMRDEVPPINVIASQIPRRVFESTYGITIPPPLEGEDPLRPPTSEELLNSYGLMRGFMTQRGLPDNPRAARYILKDYVNGKLLYCQSPPTVQQELYHSHHFSKIRKVGGHVKPTPQQIATRPYQVRPEAIDQRFFGAPTSQAHFKPINRGGAPCIPGVNVAGPVKGPRQKNFKKREKLRRRYAHLDN